MKVSKVSGVCSMISVYKNPYSVGIKKENFLKELYYAIKEHNDEVDSYNTEIEKHPFLKRIFRNKIDVNQIKTVIMVSTKGWAAYPFMKNGFKYNGNETRPARLKYLNFKKGLKAEFLRNGIGEIKI